MYMRDGIPGSWISASFELTIFLLWALLKMELLLSPRLGSVCIKLVDINL